jgi:hypothetical protein
VPRFLLSIVLLAVSCAPAAQTPTQRFPNYQYVLVVPTKPLTPNERLTLTWEPKLAEQPSSTLFEMRLCVALFGPWESVDALKKGMGTRDTKSCPPGGAAATSPTVRTASATGAPLTTEIVAPSARGFYDLRQITVYDAGNSMSAGGIVEVR